MQQDGADAVTASEAGAMFTAAGRRYHSGGGRRGPDPWPAVFAAAAMAAVIGVVGVLLRHLPISMEEGFTDGRQLIEPALWGLFGTAITAGGLWFGYAPKKGLKMRGSFPVVVAALALGATALAGVWIGLPTAAQRLEHRAERIAGEARDDALGDILTFQAESRALQWTPRLAPGAVDKETNLPALRKVIADTDDGINEFKIRLAKRRTNIRTLLDVAAATTDERVRAQEIYDSSVGDLAVNEDRYWDLQAQAVNEGCALVDAVATYRNWMDYKARGYPVQINRNVFDRDYATAWSHLAATRAALADTMKAIQQLSRVGATGTPAAPRNYRQDHSQATT